ncbi:MAG: hypothetical protein Q9162_006818 [Coniocarpon cinnabarinum]
MSSGSDKSDKDKHQNDSALRALEGKVFGTGSTGLFRKKDEKGDKQMQDAGSSAKDRRQGGESSKQEDKDKSK